MKYIYLLLSDSDCTIHSIPEPWGAAVTTEEEAKRYADGHNHTYEKIQIFETYEEAIKTIYPSFDHTKFMNKVKEERTLKEYKRPSIAFHAIKTKEIKNFTLAEVSLVNLPEELKSQWQANFLQIFPANYNELPQEHESDEKFFYKHWQGKPEDLSFEEFKNK